MDVTTVLIALLTLAAGAAAGYALARARVGAVTGERDAAVREVRSLRAERDGLVSRAVGAEAELRAARDTQQQLTERFEALSAQALHRNNEAFLALADARFKQTSTEAAGDLAKRQQAVEHLVAPLNEALTKVERQLREIEQQRTTDQASLVQQIRFVQQTGQDLRTETAALVTALRKPQTRGQWGEMQLRRVVEAAGMLERCDFDTQLTVSSADGHQRPDLVVNLAGGKHVVVDSKVPLAAFLEAMEATDETVRGERLTAHARHLRTHIDQLASKAYWSRLSATPEFVVLFVPGEAFLAQALDTDASLMEHAAGKNVVLATPMMLIAMLKAIAYAWQQNALADNAREVFELGKELYKRLGTLGDNVDKLGRSLSSAVNNFNKTVGSLEGRVLVTARKLADLEVVDLELASPGAVEELPRQLANPALVAHAEQHRAVAPLRPSDGDDGGVEPAFDQTAYGL